MPRFICTSSSDTKGAKLPGLTEGRAYEAMGPAMPAWVGDDQELAIFLVKDDKGQDRWYPLRYFTPQQDEKPISGGAPTPSFFARLLGFKGSQAHAGAR